MKEKVGVETILILGAIILVAIVLIATLVGNGKAQTLKGEQAPSQSTSLSEAVAKANNAEITAFNFKFTGYEGNQKGKILKALVAKVDEVNSTGERKVTLIGADKLDEEATYKVTTHKGSDGFIDTITVEKQ